MPRILFQYERAIFTLFPNFLRITFAYTKPFEADEEIDGTQSGAESVTPQVTDPVTPQVTPQVTALLTALQESAKTREELHQLMGIKDREHLRKAYLEPLLTAGLIERTLPDKPNSRLQKYRLTAQGAAMLKSHRDRPT